MPAPLLPEEHVTVEMDMDSKHTPTPWLCTPAGRNMRDNYNQSFAIGEGDQPNLVAGCFRDVRGGEDTAEANARFITHAVNCHDELVAAAKYFERLAALALEDHRLARLKCGHNVGTKRIGLYDDEVDELERHRETLRRAETR